MLDKYHYNIIITLPSDICNIWRRSNVLKKTKIFAYDEDNDDGMTTLNHPPYVIECETALFNLKQVYAGFQQIFITNYI